jgi:hypothetical protein
MTEMPQIQNLEFVEWHYCPRLSPDVACDHFQHGFFENFAVYIELFALVK